MIQQFEWLHTGYCTAHEAVGMRGGRWKEVTFPANFGLLMHETEGPVLFDCGYSNRFFEATAQFPYRIYRYVTPVFIRPELSPLELLRTRGIAPESVRHILISHFHGDHVCALRDFPNARFYCHQKAMDQFRQVSGWSAVKRGILPDLFPDDFEDRCVLLGDFNALPDPDFGQKWDVFGDGSIEMPYLPGHGCGQMGARFKVQGETVFLLADAAWFMAAITENRLPHPIVRLFFDDWTAYRDTLTRLQRYHEQFPAVRMIPTHCNLSHYP